MSDKPPFRREDFEIAIICALPLEFSAIPSYYSISPGINRATDMGEPPGDTNNY